MSTPVIRQDRKEKCDKHRPALKGKAFKAKDLSLRLTTTLNEEITPLYDTTTISANGALVWVVKTYFPQPDGVVAATLFRNEGGLLARIDDVPVVPGFTDVSAGGIAPSGTFAYVFDESTDAAQVRVFSVPDLTLLRTIPLPDIENPNIQLVGSAHVLNNRFTTAVYPTNAGADFVVALIDLLTGTVVTAPVQGFSNEGGFAFELNGQIYVSVTVAVQDADLNITGPAFFDIFVLDGAQLVGVLSTITPSVVGNQDIQIRRGTALIALAIGNTHLQGIPPVSGLDPTIINPSNEPTGIWIFAFDGCELCIVAIKTVNSGQIGFRSIAFDPTGRFLVATISSPRATALSTLVTYRLEAERNCELERITSVEKCCKQLVLKEVDVNLVAPITVTVQFSENGRWLVVSGGTFGDPNAPDFPEVNLFRVFYAKCAKFEEDGLLDA